MDDLEGWGAKDTPNDGYASEGELDTRALIARNNKKKKSKSGGFQVSLNDFLSFIKNSKNYN